MAMMTSTSGARRNELLHIGVVEQHLLRDRSLSASGISERLIPVQDRLRSSLDTIALDETSVMNVNRLITKALSQEEGAFEGREEWQSLIAAINELGGFMADHGHLTGWVFASLYWDHLTVCRFATAWLFTDAIRIQNGLPQLQVSFAELGPYLTSLGGAGPPLHDGQTFFPQSYGGE